MKRVAALTLLFLSFASCRSANIPRAMPPIPEGYVPTPHGLMHRSCVRQIQAGYKVSANGVITGPSGERESLPQCPYPRLDAQSHKPIDARYPPQVNGWVVSAGWLSSVPVGTLSASFVVPSAPATTGGLIYFFPGMSPNPVHGIIQPVLQYGAGPAGGGDYWIASSWYCCPSGFSNFSPPIQVNTGDTIAGSMAASCSGSTCEVGISTTDSTSNASTTLTATNTTAPFMNTAGGALEAYNINTCDQFPSSPITFTNIVLLDQNGNPLTPVWKPNNRNRQPNCGYDISTTQTSVTLSY